MSSSLPLSRETPNEPFGRPSFLPEDLALARPSRVRSEIRSRSTSANNAKRVVMTIIIGTWPRTSVRNQLHALAMGQWICRKRKMWTAAGRQELEGLALGPWASRLRRELLEIED